jgi:hypothetical protein
LPFGLEGHDHGQDLDGALKAAFLQDIPVFCAATKPARNRNFLHKICAETLPIQINSTNGSFEKSAFSPEHIADSRHNFAILGEDVPPGVEFGKSGPKGSYRCFSGLAVATIIAGGLTAAALAYWRQFEAQGAFKKSPFSGEEGVEELLDLMSDLQGGYHNLKPQNLYS